MAQRFIIVNTGLKNNSNIDDIYCVDLANRKIIKTKFSSIKQLDTIDTDNYKYKTDDIKVTESCGTLAYVNNEHNFYGVFEVIGDSIKLLWISKENFWSDPKHKSVCNTNNELFDITDLGDQVFDANWFKGIKANIVRNLRAFPRINVINFKEELYVNNNATNGTNDNSTDDTKVELLDNDIMPEDLNENNIVSFGDTNEENGEALTDVQDVPKENNNINENDLSSLVVKGAELLIRTHEVEKLKKELIEKNKRLNELIRNIENSEFTDVIDTLIDIDHVYTFEDRVEDNAPVKKEDYMCEMLLKYLSNTDAITISKEYYCKLHTYMIKQLESNLSYSKYRAIIKIKFETTSEYSIYAIADYDESLDTVRINIIKSYSNIDLTNDQILHYYTQYEANRRKNSMYIN